MFLYSTVSTLKPGGIVNEFCRRMRTALLTDGRDGGDDLTQLKLVQNGCLTSGIETDLNELMKLLDVQRSNVNWSYHQNTCQLVFLSINHEL